MWWEVAILVVLNILLAISVGFAIAQGNRFLVGDTVVVTKPGAWHGQYQGCLGKIIDMGDSTIWVRIGDDIVPCSKKELHKPY